MFVNFALATNGTIASATTSVAGTDPARTINGYRHTNNNWPALGTVMQGGGWAGGANGSHTVEYNFGQARTISEVHVFTIADTVNYIINPNLSDVFTVYGLVDYAIDYWNGSAWINIVAVINNNKVWREHFFVALTTSKVRIVCTNYLGGAPRIIEFEAYGEAATSFERPRSAFIDSIFTKKALLNARAYNTELAFDITLRDGTPLRYASASVTMDTLSKGVLSLPITPLTFTPRVSGKPEFRHTQSKSVDSSRIEVVNLDYILSEIIPTTNRLFDSASIVAYLCFPKQNGNYEGMIYGNFVVNEISADDETASFGLVSDISARNAMLGKEMTQRCVNILGDGWCGVNNLPPGAVCTKVFSDKVAGCGYWGGVFNGVPYLNPGGYVSGYSGDLPVGGGFDLPIGGSGCPDPSMWFRAANGGYIQGFDLKEGDVILWNETAVRIKKIEKRYEAYRYFVKTNIGANYLGSASSKLLRSYEDDKGTALHAWKPEYNLVARTPEHGRRTIFGDLNQYSIEVATPGDILRIETTAPHKYDCGVMKGFTLEHHNNKIFEPILQY